MKYALFLQGINIGGNRRLPMDDLKKCLEGLGFLAVRTYIQSGNAVFEAGRPDTGAGAATDIAGIEAAVESALLALAGFPVTCVARTEPELSELVQKMPFPGCDEGRLCVTFLKTRPDAADAEAFSALDLSPERFVLSGREIYILCAAGFSDSRVTNSLVNKRLKIVSTNRNWRTVRRVLAMAAANAPQGG